MVFILSILVNVGMWFERFVIVVISLHRDFLPSNWDYFKPTWVDICTFLGTFGLFFTMFLLFMRFLPMIADSEVKGVTPQADPHHPLGGAKRRRETLMSATRKPYGMHRRIRQHGGHAARGGKSPRRRLPQVGRVHAVSRSTAWTRPWA